MTRQKAGLTALRNFIDTKKTNGRGYKKPLSFAFLLYFTSILSIQSIKLIYTVLYKPINNALNKVNT